ncbi:unnamed protein product [Moneuplotes crassus]|uniref:Uncharacterized protein n=1 Tax=Euplotes crassus TaxID=5936 RepID=A0AAD2D777_EUPCR|nr:unnamed protein product [Moneuplotes crassus]
MACFSCVLIPAFFVIWALLQSFKDIIFEKFFNKQHQTEEREAGCSGNNSNSHGCPPPTAKVKED